MKISNSLARAPPGNSLSYFPLFIFEILELSMGLLGTVKEKKEQSIQTGRASTGVDSILGIGTNTITPTNPGEFQVLETAPTLMKQRKFTRSEANALKRKEAEHKIHVAATEDAFKSLEQIAKGDVRITHAHNHYRTVKAQTNFAQIASNGAAAIAVNKLGTGYASVGEAVQHNLLSTQSQVAAVGFAPVDQKSKEYAKRW